MRKVRFAASTTNIRHAAPSALCRSASTIACIARFAALTGDDELLDQAERLFRTAHGMISRSGATPEEEPCCTLMEMTTAALALTSAGRGTWWDTIDRYFRNQTTACQFTDPASVKVGSVPGEPQPWDDTRDIVNRSIGGFTWASPWEHLHWDRRLMLCCGGHAIWTLGKIVEHAVTEDAAGLSVNLHFSLETPLASVTNHEPFEGRIEVLPNRAGDVRVRKPSYAALVHAALDDTGVDAAVCGDYLVFPNVKPGAKIELQFPMPEKTTEEVVMLPQREGGGVGGWLGPKSDPIVGHRTQTAWRGNTVLSIDSSNTRSRLSEDQVEGWTPQPEHGLYLTRLQRYRDGAGRDATAAFFMPERTFTS